MSASLPTLYQNFIHLGRYARWIDGVKRRETWEETVDRYMSFMCDVQCRDKIPNSIRETLRNAILRLDIMPSMRCMMTAGKALERDNIAGFNCTALYIDNPVAFDEILYLLLCGCGVGFSVERQFIANLPSVAEKLRPSKTIIVVEDSKIGWANALRELISMLYQGRIPSWDLSQIRPAGSPLKTFGGRASGPEPLDRMLKCVVSVFSQAAGRKLTSIECHDICCFIADCVVVGGVRRAALISLSNPSDNRMRDAKSGQWWIENPQRELANISTMYTDKPSVGLFLDDWKALYDSKSGERGIINRKALQKIAASFGRRPSDYDYICNPCVEVILKSMSCCNLTEVIVRPEDGADDICRKIQLATILGTMQASLTNFRYLRKEWSENVKDEALLGVSLTGIYDNALTRGDSGKRELASLLQSFRQQAEETNKEWAPRIGVKVSAAICTCKPSGTVSQLCDTASGLHPRYSEYYIRRVRADKSDPLARLMKESGFICEDDVRHPDRTWVFSFPIRSPKNSVVYHHTISAIEHLEMWKTYQIHWCHHKPSVTINVGEDEWLDVAAWIYRNWDIVSGISFLPKMGHTYQQAPYESCDEARWKDIVAAQPKSIDWSLLSKFEDADNTAGSQTLACTNAQCEIVDLVKK